MQTKEGRELTVLGSVGVNGKEQFIVDLGSLKYTNDLHTRYILLPRTSFIIPGEEFVEIVVDANAAV